MTKCSIIIIQISNIYFHFVTKLIDTTTNSYNETYTVYLGFSGILPRRGGEGGYFHRRALSFMYYLCLLK